MTQQSDNQMPCVTISALIGDEIDNATLRFEMPLTREMRTFLRPRHLKMCDQFHRFELVGPDHIEGRLGWVAEDYASEAIGQVARTIRFMDATGLLPTSEEIYGIKSLSKEQRLPGQDHATTWRDPETNAIVMLDEPYGYVDNLFTDRVGWAKRHGFSVHRLNYQGTHRPGHGTVCDLVYPVEQKVFVQSIIKRIEEIDILCEIPVTEWSQV